jgi:methionyl-tRNA formyltransferase
VTLAAEMALDRVLPQLLAGTAPHVLPDLKAGGYFGGRKPEDGRIDWTQPAQAIHNLVRAVAPPYPGAFCDLPGGGRIRILRTLLAPDRKPAHTQPTLHRDGEQVFADCADGRVLHVLAWDGDWNGRPVALA